MLHLPLHSKPEGETDKHTDILFIFVGYVKGYLAWNSEQALIITVSLNNDIR